MKYSDMESSPDATLVNSYFGRHVPPVEKETVDSPNGDVQTTDPIVIDLVVENSLNKLKVEDLRQLVKSFDLNCRKEQTKEQLIEILLSFPKITDRLYREISRY